MRSKCLAVTGLAAVIVASGCHKRVPVVAVTPPASATSASPLLEADRALAAGNYDEAARNYESHARSTTPGDLERDEALLGWALTFALRPAPATDWPRATALLKQLLDESPNSRLKGPVSLILQLHADLDLTASDAKARDLRIRQLSTELDRLKKIDSDRRKRP